MIRSLHTLALAAALAVGAPALALAAPPDGAAVKTTLAPAADAPAPWEAFGVPAPIVFGDYIAVPGGDSTTLGAMSIDVTPDSRGTVGGAIYFYDDAGKMVVHALGGTFTYNSEDALRTTGIIADVPLTTFEMSGGPCRGCAPHDRVTTPTNDVTRFAWTGPRTGILTVNGVTQKMVHAMSGPPLVAEADLSGDWLMVMKFESNHPPMAHRESVVNVRLTPSSRAYGVMVDPIYGYTIPVTPPPAGSRQYDISCAPVASDPWCGLRFFSWWPDDKIRKDLRWMAWFEPDTGVGHIMAYLSASNGSASVIRHVGTRLFVAGERMVGLMMDNFTDFDWYEASPRQRGTYIFTRPGRIPFNGDWRKIACSVQTNSYSDCNHGS